MADEIVEVRRATVKKTLLAFEALFLIPVDPPIVVNGQNVILRPRSELPPILVEKGLITDDELLDIEAGVLTFAEERVKQRKGETLASVLARVRLRYSLVSAQLLSEARTAYAETGHRYNA